MTALLDINVLVALAWPNHVHHSPAQKWFRRYARQGWATCPATESGFTRISSNRRVLPDAVTPREALTLLEQFRGLPGHSFLTDDVSLTDSPFVERDRLATHRQVSDAHLLAVARAHKARLVTFDRGVSALLAPDLVRATLTVIGND